MSPGKSVSTTGGDELTQPVLPCRLQARRVGPRHPQRTRAPGTSSRRLQNAHSRSLGKASSSRCRLALSQALLPSGFGADQTGSPLSAHEPGRVTIPRAHSSSTVVTDNRSCWTDASKKGLSGSSQAPCPGSSFWGEHLKAPRRPSATPFSALGLPLLQPHRRLPSKGFIGNSLGIPVGKWRDICLFYLFFWPRLRPVDVPGPGVEPEPQQ